jgi:preprotein translocase subunit SecD
MVSMSAMQLVALLVWSGCSSRPQVVLRIAPQQTPSAQQSALLKADASVIAARMKRLFTELSPNVRSGAPEVRVAGDRITVLLSEAVDSERLKYLLTAPGVLEFRLMPRYDTFQSIVLGIDKCSRLPTASNSAGKAPRGLNELFTAGHFAIAEFNVPIVRDLMTRIDTTILGDYEVMFGPNDNHRDSLIRTFFLVRRTPELSAADGRLIDTASVRWLMPPPDSALAIDFRLSGQANSKYNPVDKFAETTERSVNRRLAIVLDSVVVSAPAIMKRIPDGKCMILTDGVNAQRAHDMANVIASGALAAPLVIEKMGFVRR